MPRWCRCRKEGRMPGDTNMLGHWLQGCVRCWSPGTSGNKTTLGTSACRVARQPLLRLGDPRGAPPHLPEGFPVLPWDKSPTCSWSAPAPTVLTNILTFHFLPQASIPTLLLSAEKIGAHPARPLSTSCDLANVPATIFPHAVLHIFSFFTSASEGDESPLLLRSSSLLLPSVHGLLGPLF